MLRKSKLVMLEDGSNLMSTTRICIHSGLPGSNFSSEIHSVSSFFLRSLLHFSPETNLPFCFVSSGFEYKNDSVLVVDKWSYYHCNSSNPVSVFKDEITVISLDNPGPMYFVSGDPGHCERGQRLLVDVLELHPKSPPPSITPSEMSPAPSPLSSSGIQLSSETMFPVSIASSSLALVVIAFTM